MPITTKDVERLEKISGQMDGLHKEVGALAKKSPNDGLNKFKLQFVNAVIVDANEFLGADYRPLAEFERFDVDQLPTNSDVAFILALYIEELERKRTDNITNFLGTQWVYDLRGSAEKIRTAPPRKIQEKR